MQPTQAPANESWHHDQATGRIWQVVHFGGTPSHESFEALVKTFNEHALPQFKCVYRKGSFLVYLGSEQEIDLEEKKRVLQTVMASVQKAAQQLGMPDLGSATLQVSNCLYTLTASGDLEESQCKQPPRLLSAQVIHSNHSSPTGSTNSQHGAQPSPHQKLLEIWAADGVVGDRLRFQFENESETVTVNAVYNGSASLEQPVQLNITVPADAKHVVAVELLRGSFASQPVGVSWPVPPNPAQEQAPWEERKNMSGAANFSNLSGSPVGSKETGMA